MVWPLVSKGVLAVEVPIVNQPKLEVKECRVDGQRDRECLGSVVASYVGDDILKEIPGQREGCDI